MQGYLDKVLNLNVIDIKEESLNFSLYSVKGCFLFFLKKKKKLSHGKKSTLYFSVSLNVESKEIVCACARACVCVGETGDGGEGWCLTSSIKGAFQLPWKQFPAEGTFILKLCLASTDCSCVWQSSRLAANCPPPRYNLGRGCPFQISA